jgi:hypothetical protein
MAKQLSAKELGIPSGYRLSQANIDNIVRVATKMKFKKQVIDLAWKEVELMACLYQELYPIEYRREYHAAVNKIARREVSSSDVFHIGDRINVGENEIGGSYYWSEDRGTSILGSKVFQEVLKSMNRDDLIEKMQIDPKYTNEAHKWFHENFQHLVVPANSAVKVTPRHALQNIPKDLAKETNKFFKQVDKVKEKAKETRMLIKQILATYTSAVKLCNDAPEFVEYINDAVVFNKDGRRCTDMGTADMIQQLRKS